MDNTTLNILDLKDWFLDKSGGVSPEMIDKNLELGIKLSDDWYTHTIFLYHAAKKAAQWEADREYCRNNLSAKTKGEARDAVSKHLRSWTDKAMKFKGAPHAWCIPHSLAAFDMLRVRPPSRYVQLCQNKAMGSMKRCERGHIQEWYSAGSALTLRFDQAFIQALCLRTVILAPEMKGYELYMLAHKMAIMDAVHEVQTTLRSPHIAKAFRQIFSNPIVRAEIKRVEDKEEPRMIADAKCWFDFERVPVSPDGKGRDSSLQYKVAEKFKDAGAKPIKRRTIKDGHTIDLSFVFNDCNFDIEVDGPDHFIRCTDGHVITMNGSSLFQTLLIRKKDPDKKIIRLPYAIYDEHHAKPEVWRGLCREIEAASTGAYIVDSHGHLSSDLLTRCRPHQEESRKASSPA
jgi:hypothetical protein